MKLLILLSSFFLLGFVGYCPAQKGLVPVGEIISDLRDREIFNGIINEFSEKKDLPTGELLVGIGKSLEGTPYVAATLEKSDDEKLVVNLREMDCTTFVENCLALALTIKSGNPDYDRFLQELQHIRYRNGVRNQYPSRLHYFSEWLADNAAKNKISLPAKEFGVLYPNRVDFMSKHPEKYPCLKEHPKFVAEMGEWEKAISEKEYYFVPKDKIVEVERFLKEGDIIGITTSIAGLDIVHAALLTRVNGRIHILHASSSEKKVLVSSDPLADYLVKSKIQTGIMVGRSL